MQRGIRSISQSALNTYRDCPYAYYLKYVENCQPIFWSFDMLDVGSYAHNAIDRYYKNHVLTEADSYRDVLAYTYDIFKEIWDITLSVEDYKKAYTCLDHHAMWEFKNIKDDLIRNPITEAKIKIDGLYTIIDYIDLNNQMVVDWKTNKWPSLSHRYRIQAEFYKRTVDKKFGTDLSHFYFFFLYPNQWRTVKFGNKKQNKVKEEVDDLLNKIAEAWDNSEFPKEPRTKKGCSSCLYRYYCKRGEKKCLIED